MHMRGLNRKYANNTILNFSFLLCSASVIFLLWHFMIHLNECITLRILFSYKPVCSHLATTYYVATYKTIHMYYLKNVNGLINWHVVGCNKLTTNCFVTKPYPRIYIYQEDLHQLILSLMELHMLPRNVCQQLAVIICQWYLYQTREK